MLLTEAGDVAEAVPAADGLGDEQCHTAVTL